MAFRFGDKRDWFPKARFGMFVHWGLYALDGWHEQRHLRQRVDVIWPLEQHAEITLQLAMIGRVEGDEIVVNAPAGDLAYEIITIEYI